MRKLPPHKRMKPKHDKQQAHMARVAGIGCLVCGMGAVVHHVNERGHGRETKDDRWTAPLCPFHHNMGGHSIHMLGSNARFFEMHGIDLAKEAQFLWTESVNMGIYDE